MAKGSVFRIIINGTLWSFLGVILTVAFFYWSEYRNPYDIRITVDDEFDLVEVREKIENLKILYKGDDILTSNKQIKVLSLSIRNNGKTVLQQDYDQLQPFGVRFGNASILSAEVAHSNSPYLQKGILQAFSRERVAGADSSLNTRADQLVFPKLILEKGKFVNLKIFLLQQATAQPLGISVFRKIANIDSITVARFEKRNAPEKILDTQEFGYFIGGYIALLVVAVTASVIKDKLDDKKRARKCDEFLAKNKNLSMEQLAIVDVYRSKWSIRVQRLIRQLSEGNKVINAAEMVSDELDRIKNNPIRLFLFPMLFRRLQFIELPSEVFSVEGSMVGIREDQGQFIDFFFREVGVSIKRAAT